MITKTKNRVIQELEDFPENKINSLLDYIYFLKFEDQIEIPNETTEQTFKDTDAGKNLNEYNTLNDFFNKMES